MTAKISSFLLLAILCQAAPAKEVVIAVDHADIDSTTCLDVPSSERQFACHRLERGKGFVVAQRKYWQQKTLDDDAFEKLTIYFPTRPKKGQALKIPNDTLFVFFSSGPSSFPGKHGCFGSANSGVIVVKDINESRIVIDLNVALDLKSPLGWSGECGERSLKKRYTAKFIEFETLNPWLGLKLPNNDAWNEAHP